MEGNFIGTNAGGANLGNAVGVLIDTASFNMIGGTAPNVGNTIAFNSGPGVQVNGPTAKGNSILSTMYSDVFELDVFERLGHRADRRCQ